MDVFYGCSTGLASVLFYVMLGGGCGWRGDIELLGRVKCYA